jgi:hypothetical protein
MVQNRRKLSEILRELANSLMRNPRAVPTSEAAHMALLFAHVAWNRALGHRMSDKLFRSILEELEQEEPELWNELADNDAERMIEQLVALKQTRFADDDRFIQVCGMRNGNVHVEWHEGRVMQEIECTTIEHIARALELVAGGDLAEATRHLSQTTGLTRKAARQYVTKLRELLPRSDSGGAGFGSCRPDRAYWRSVARELSQYWRA